MPPQRMMMTFPDRSPRSEPSRIKRYCVAFIIVFGVIVAILLLLATLVSIRDSIEKHFGKKAAAIYQTISILAFYSAVIALFFV